MTNENPEIIPEKSLDKQADLAKLKAEYTSKIAKLSQALDYHNIFVFELNKSFELEYYNTSFSEWLDNNELKQPALHKPVKTELPFLPKELFIEADKAWKSDTPIGFISNLTINNTVFKVKIFLDPKKLPEGDRKLVVSFSELSSIRKIQTREFKSGKILFNLLNELDFHLLLCGVDGELILFNQAAEDFFISAMNYKLKKGDTLVNKFEDFEFKKIWEKNVDFCLAGNESRFLSSIQIKDKIYLLEFTFFPFRAEENIIGYSILVKNISDQNRVEKKLFLSEERYCDLVEKAEVGIAFDNVKGEITFFNEKFCELFGYTLKEMAGKSHRDIVDPRYIDKISTYHNYRIKGKNVPLQYCFKGLNKDGNIFDVELITSEITDDKGNVIGTKNYFWDVTLREKIKHELKRHKSQLELITKILRHDLINNFSAIRSGIRLYRRTDEEAMLDAIITKTEAGVHLIQQMRELENLLKIDAKLEITSTDKIFAEIKSEYPELELIISGSAEIFVDSGIFSLFQNLINNSVAHGKADKIHFDITSELNMCKIVYKDNGTGIAEKHREHIFKMNYTSRKNDHSGLGLYIVTQLIERYEGSIKLGENDKGAKIIMTFRT